MKKLFCLFFLLVLTNTLSARGGGGRCPGGPVPCRPVPCRPCAPCRPYCPEPYGPCGPCWGPSFGVSLCIPPPCPPPCYIEPRPIVVVQPEPEVRYLPQFVGTYSCGKIVQLTDGSLWDTRYDSDITTRWLTTDLIEVIRNPYQGCAYQLRNQTTGEVIRADIIAQPSSYSQGCGDTLQHNLECGVRLTLDDFSYFNVNYADVVKTRAWLPGEKIERRASNDYNYPYVLYNANRRETAGASLVVSNK